MCCGLCGGNKRLNNVINATVCGTYNMHFTIFFNCVNFLVTQAMLSHPFNTILEVLSIDAHLMIAVTTNVSGCAANAYVYTCKDETKVRCDDRYALLH